MVLKTFRGPDLPTALRQVRKELGPDTLVLGTSETKGRFGVPVVEVTVAASRVAESVDRTDDDPTVRALAAEIRDLRGLLETERAAKKAPGLPGKKIGAFCHQAVEALIGSGLDPDLAERFGRITAGERMTAGSLAAAVTRELESILKFTPLPLGGRCLFVVGPPGSGKTTTVAKLASRVCAPDRPVVFGVADAERIGGFEQADIYSRYIGTRTMRLDDAGDLRAALDATADRGLVLVDTCGIGSQDRQRLEQIQALRESVPDAEVAVLLPAGLHHVDANRVLDRMAPLQPTCVGLSRVDDTSRPGELLTALHGRQTPLAFLTNGHRVPDALEVASPRNLASLLLGKPATPSIPTETHA